MWPLGATSPFLMMLAFSTLDRQCIDGVREDLAKVRDDADLDRIVGSTLRRIGIGGLWKGTPGLSRSLIMAYVICRREG